MEPVIFTSEDGTQQKFYVEEETRVGGTDYLLVTTSEEDDAEALILKDLSSDTDEEAEFVPVEDEDELAAVLKVFETMMDDIEIEI